MAIQLLDALTEGAYETRDDNGRTYYRLYGERVWLTLEEAASAAITWRERNAA